MRVAEYRTGWSDPDGDGMYMDFVNGQYDWGDINGPTFSELVAGALVVALVIDRKRGRPHSGFVVTDAAAREIRSTPDTKAS